MKQWIGIATGWPGVSLLMHLIFLAGPFMGLCHLYHSVICQLRGLTIVNKLPYLEIQCSMVQQVYLALLHLLGLELALPDKVLNVQVQFSSGLLFGLLDVP